MSPLDYLYNRINYERVSPTVHKGAFRLRRMRHLLARINDPQHSTQVIHIGGTKGKGSTCAMLSSMLVAAGHRVGLYTSPHLERLEERFQVDGTPCQHEEMLDLIQTVRIASNQVEQTGEGAPTFFELTTAMAFEYFRRKDCKVSVIEVGLGGRLDSTNVCDPVVSVLTSVGLDHQHILGDTVEKIAFEKAGIIKPGVPVVSGFQLPGPAQVVREVAAQRAAPLWEINTDFHYQTSNDQTAQNPAQNRIDFIATSPGLTTRSGWAIGLEGAHQQHNAAVALAAIDAIEPLGLAPTPEQQQHGLTNTRCIGRIQRFQGRKEITGQPQSLGQPETILDTAHNVDSIKALRAVLMNRPADGKTVVVFGTSADKDAEPMLALLEPLADTLILTRYQSNPRWFDLESLANMTKHSNFLTEPHPQAAFEQAVRAAGPRGRVVICGSFFLAAELLPVLRNFYEL